MFIDADEIICDCSDIIRFFNSGEYKNYKNASYIVRSYGDDQDYSLYADIRSLRLFTKATGVRLKGKVHEAVSVLEAPTKFLNCVAEHYGYMFMSGGKLSDSAYDKSRRNLDILFRMLEEESEPSPNIYNQIADCYGMLKDWDKALEYIDMGFERVDNERIEFVPYFAHKTDILTKCEKFIEAEQLCADYFDPSKNPARISELATDCFIYLMWAYSLYKLKNYKAAIEKFISFFEMYRKFTKGKLNTVDLMVDIFRVDESGLKFAYDTFFRCCYQEKAYSLANEYTKAMPLESYFDNESVMVNHLNIRIEMMNNIGYGGLDGLYRRLNEKWRDHLLNRIRYNILSVSKENRRTIIKKLSVLDEKPSELSKIYGAYFDKHTADEKAIGDFLKKYGSENSEDILYILLDTRSDITPFLQTEDFFADRAVQLLLLSFSASKTLLEDYDADKVSDEGLLNAVNFYGWVMLRAMEINVKITVFFEKYAMLGEKWVKVFEDSGGELPGDIRAALLVRNVVSAKKSRNTSAANTAAKKLTEIVPDLMPVIDAYKEENPEAFRVPTKRVNSEFEQLAAQVKKNIRDLIGAGDAENSRALLREFEGLCPDDPDIDELRNEINNLLQ